MRRGSLPPLPWTYQTVTREGLSEGCIDIFDADGRKIASLWGTLDEKLAMAELIRKASCTKFKEAGR